MIWELMARYAPTAYLALIFGYLATCGVILD